MKDVVLFDLDGTLTDPGDRKHDMIGALHHHIEAIGVTYGGYGSQQELVQAGACRICHTVSELGALLEKDYASKV